MTANRSLVAGALALLCLAGPVAPAGAASPVVPLVSHHQYWDHQWFVWLPRHPVYESVEVMSVDTTGSLYRAVWVFFTERRGGKRQVHFFNDRQIVEYFPGSHYREIEYKRSGNPGRGQRVQVALIGLDGELIEIAVDAADKALTRKGAGLADQSGHGADTVVLLFHRDRNALARTHRVRIGGRDYSFRPGDDPAGRHRIKAAYSAGIQIGVIPFGNWSFRRHGEWLKAPAAGFSFALAQPGGGMRLAASLPGHPTDQITVDFDGAGALAGYRHDTDTHRLALSLDDALPLAPDAPRTARRFAIHMDPEQPVARGEVVSTPAAGGRRLTWRFHSPRWAAAYPFESLIRPNGSGHRLTIRSLRR